MSTVPTSRRRAARRGSAYALVLAVSMLVVLVGLSALAMSRLAVREAAGAGRAEEAAGLAFTAVEHALAVIDATPDWRDQYLSNDPIDPIPLGPGTYEWKLVDEDGDLENDPADPMRIVGTGVVGGAVQSVSLAYDAASGPLDVLRTTLHVSGPMTTVLDATIATSGGPVSTNDVLQHDGRIEGDVEAVAILGSGVITGSIVEPAVVKPMPPAGRYDLYAAMATDIPYATFGGHFMSAPLLSAAHNPWGETNANGIYHVRVPAGFQLKVRISRVAGTLVIMAEPGAQVKFDAPAVFHPHASRYPALVIHARNAQVDLTVPAGTISEGGLGANLNPPGSPYEGEEDATLDDTYPSCVHGVVHVIITDGPAIIGNGVTVVGSIVVDGGATIYNATLTHDPALLTDPPLGYAQATPGPDPASWRREVSP